MALNAYQNRESLSWRILNTQRKGAATIGELEDVLGVTTTAVRQQLQTLQADGYVSGRAYMPVWAARIMPTRSRRRRMSYFHHIATT